MIEIFALSIIQGITEFLPISSSSHLIIISEFLNFTNKDISIDISLHIGSFIAVVLYFNKEIINFYENKILFLKVFTASLPVMVIGFLLLESNYIEKIRSLEIIAWTTLIFGILLYISDKFKLEKNLKNLNYKSIIFIGFLQIFSLIPGVSRSGIAITAARFLKFKRVDSAKISFLISIPILGAVSLFGIKNIILSESTIFTQLNLIAIFLSFLFSLITIKFFLSFINKFNLNLFIFYRIFLGFFLLALYYL
tara:strand:- start:426 stop:1181 length:756 start_codon:yes stop_codon:yes gene_type:complete